MDGENRSVLHLSLWKDWLYNLCINEDIRPLVHSYYDKANSSFFFFLDGDQMESMDTVSLQAVTLADGSTAYIQHDSKGSFSDGQIMDGQVIQLEDGSAAYVQHVSMPKAGRTQILAIS